MSESKLSDGVHQNLVQSVKSAMSQLDALTQNQFSAEPASDESIRVLAEGLKVVLTASLATLAATTNSLGECREEVPYSPMRPVRDSEGNFKWCCNHNPEHCS